MPAGARGTEVSRAPAVDTYRLMARCDDAAGEALFPRPLSAYN